MTSNKKTLEDRLAEEIAEDLLSAPDQEILVDAKEAGVDVQAFAHRMRVGLAPKRPSTETGAPKVSEPSVIRSGTRSARKPNFARGNRSPDTLAARLANKKSSSDQAGIDEDLDDLFNDDAWPDERFEED
ncbi:hypothetical protein T35B1_18448 [Salinisphaera shabanensis T35B1]|uniref:hypothetical protein n=1 Tax=Salinisphaera shabanensis TaxID=180542 RepID=UPI00333E749D